MIIGHLGGDAELRNFNGKDVLLFSVADSRKNAQGEKVTTWVDCSKEVSDRSRYLIEYLKKGRQVYCQGAPDIKMFEGKDGKMKAQMRLYCSAVYLLNHDGNKPDGTTPKPQDDDMPF